MRLAAMVRDAALTWSGSRRHRPDVTAGAAQPGERQEHLARLLADHHGFSAPATSLVLGAGGELDDPLTPSPEPLHPA